MPQMKETPLIRCAHNGHYNTVQYLVEQGTDVNAIDLVSLPPYRLVWASQSSLWRLQLMCGPRPLGPKHSIKWSPTLYTCMLVARCLPLRQMYHARLAL
jgi:hypothetical protein